jgi:hypothetical protein
MADVPANEVINLTREMRTDRPPKLAIEAIPGFAGIGKGFAVGQYGKPLAVVATAEELGELVRRWASTC